MPQPFAQPRIADVVLTAVKTAATARVARFIEADLRACGLPCHSLDQRSMDELSTMVARAVRQAAANVKDEA
ncbi:hypothetical protein QCE63_35190 [Caballeronia sp. LZ065]|uniref:hypothetical protein n=1 Tax=Caballeronia sp. LZ065 TaxID=3038571 RepID=UPI002863E4DD|nr:hypothetical protein [Caballeronia sp. LZ065]MDR5784642.1 hypothetical protein [Caballeronia sp. LZ065]